MRMRYFEDGGGTGGDGGGDGGGTGGGQGPGDGPAGADGMDGIGLSGVSDSDAGMGGSYDPYGYGQSQAQYVPPPPYMAQQLPSANTAIYRPSYTDYSLGRSDTVGTYGQNFQPYFSQGIGGFDYGRMFGNMPSYQGYQIPYLMSNYGGGIADLYSNPQYFSNYGIAGLYR